MRRRIFAGTLAALLTTITMSLAIVPAAQASVHPTQSTFYSQCDTGGAGSICWYTSSDVFGHGVFGSDEANYTPVAWIFDDSTGTTGLDYSTVQSTACAGDTTNGPFSVQAFNTDYCGYQVGVLWKSGSTGNTCMAQASGLLLFHDCPGSGNSTATIWVRDTDSGTWVNVVRSDFCRPDSADCFDQENLCTGNPHIHVPMGISDDSNSTDQLCTSSYGFDFRTDS